LIQSTKIDLKINKLVYKGYGLGFHGTKAVFVPGSVPEDVLQVEVVREKSGVSFARIEKILSKSPFRVEPVCEAFSRCGGCNWLNIEYSKQIEWKGKILTEIFNNYENLKTVSFIPCSDPFNYRNRSYLPLANETGEPIFGMYAQRSHRVIPHNACRIQPRIFDQLAQTFLNYVKASKAEIYNEDNHTGNLKYIGFRIDYSANEILFIVVTKKRKLPFSKQLVRVIREKEPRVSGVIQNINPARTNVILGKKENILDGKVYLWDRIGKLRIKTYYNAFSQINSEITLKLYDFILTNIEQETRVVDAYCGSGSIGLYIARKVKQTIGIDNNATSIKAAKDNALENHLDNCFFLEGSVENELGRIVKSYDINTIIFDPPRKGLTPEIVIIVARSDITRIIYVSCDPTTQVRDIGLFCKQGFELKRIQGFDMFPHTYHIENVAILER